MKISYAITVCNELDEVTKLLNTLLKFRRKEDEIVILFDKGNGTAEVWNRIIELKGEKNVVYKAATFKHHFADWKNQLTEMCSGDYIFQIDADEIPNENLINQLPAILESNEKIEVVLVPRINTVEGLTQDHIVKWGWRVDEKGHVNFPDYQWRIWKNVPDINWKNKVHEVLEGFNHYSTLPAKEEYCLYHPKDIKRQEKQNDYYSTL
tara:strand:+ start:9613 stop:10236 length:624 start_codon:yes stop_codon:yes gene_type:complete